MIERNTKIIYNYLLLQFNPLVFYFIISTGGEGITGPRLVFSITISILFIIYAFFLRRKVTIYIYVYIYIVTFLVILQLFFDTIRGRLDYGLYVIFIEYIFVFLVFSYFAPKNLLDGFLKYSRVIIFFMAVNFSIWIYGLVSGEVWGIFRVYISGFTLNRIPDFILVMFVPWMFSSSGILLSFFVTFYTIATSYRTLYLGYFIAVFSIFVLGSRTVKLNILRNGIFLFCGLLVIVSIFPDAGKLIERVVSLFLHESKVAGEASKSQRVSDFIDLTVSFPNCIILGCGSIDPKTNIAYYNYPFYIFWIFHVFGFLGIFLNLWVFFPFIKKNNFENKDIFEFSIYLMLIIVVIFFPYFHYFPLVFFVAFFNNRLVRMF